MAGYRNFAVGKFALENFAHENSQHPRFVAVFKDVQKPLLYIHPQVINREQCIFYYMFYLHRGYKAPNLAEMFVLTYSLIKKYGPI